MQITHNNTAYVLDPEQAIKLGVLKPVVVHKVGNRYSYNGSEYILGAGGESNWVTLINLKNGYTYGGRQKVDDWDNICEADWRRVSDGKMTIVKDN